MLVLLPIVQENPFLHGHGGDAACFLFDENFIYFFMKKKERVQNAPNIPSIFEINIQIPTQRLIHIWNSNSLTNKMSLKFKF